MTKRLVILVLALFMNQTLSILYAQEIFPGGGTGSYNLTYPNPAADGCIQTPGNCDLYNLIGGGAQAGIKKGPNYKGPLQTHQWWTTGLWNAGKNNAICDSNSIFDLESLDFKPSPNMNLLCTDTSFIIRHRDLALNGGGPNNTGSGYADADISIGILNPATQRFLSVPKTMVDDYGDFHVKFLKDYLNGDKLNMTACAGSPFCFFEKNIFISFQ